MAVGFDAQTAALESERVAWTVEKIEAFSTAKVLKSALATITTNDGELNAVRATLAAAQA